MAGYSFQTLALGGSFSTTTIITSGTNLGLPATYNCALFSGWLATSGASFNFSDPAGATTGPAIGFEINITPQTLPPTVQWSVTNASGAFIGFGWNTFPPVTGILHLLVSVDAPHNVAQLYVNDVACPLSTSDPTDWFSTAPIARAPAMAAYTLLTGSSCIGDIWFTDQATFTDLGVTANRRKFINADLTPVNVGADGSLPFGSAPRVFLHCGVGDPPAGFTANAGTGGSFSPALPLGLCVGYPAAPPPPSVTLAMDDVLCTTEAAATENLISLAWSDDRGHSYGNPVSQPMGAMGDYPKSLQWRRLGYARDRVFLLEWSVPAPTSLQGAWIRVGPADS